MSEERGRVVMLIGTSSAGKTTAARALQACLDEHFLLIGVDTFFHMVDPRWGGAQAGPLSSQGFRYDRCSTDHSGEPTVGIKYGPVGERILRGMHRAVAALAWSGNNVIVDEMLLDDRVMEDWLEALAGLPVFVVRIWAPLNVLEARERERNNIAGLARGHLLANQPERRDLDVDTSSNTPAEVASTIAAALASRWGQSW